MEYKIIIAGFGGQGILFAGKILAQAAANEGYEVSWLPSYGPEMRGGTANCQVVISDDEISSPSFKCANALIAMNAPSLRKFAGNTKDIIITDKLFEGENQGSVELLYIDSSEEANKSLINMVMLGALAAKTGIVSFDSVVSAIQIMTTAEKALADIKALEGGYNFYM